MLRTGQVLLPRGLSGAGGPQLSGTTVHKVPQRVVTWPTVAGLGQARRIHLFPQIKLPEGKPSFLTKGRSTEKSVAEHLHKRTCCHLNPPFYL